MKIEQARESAGKPLKKKCAIPGEKLQNDKNWQPVCGEFAAMSASSTR